MDLTSPKNYLRQLWTNIVKEIVTDEPQELNDAANYGLYLDQLACKTGYHPALILGIQKRAEQFGRVFDTFGELQEYTVVIASRMSNDDIQEMIAANLASPNNPPSPR